MVYQISMETTLNEFDINVMNNVGPVSGHSLNYYELAQEPVSGNLYASETDFFSFVNVHIFNASNNELASFNVGISPGTIVFDVRPLSAGINDLTKSISVYPNPTNEIVTVSNTNGAEITILDLSGKTLINSSSNEINVSNLSAGTYFVSSNGIKTKFVKQ